MAVVTEVETFPLTVDAVHELRERHGFVSPITPLSPGEIWPCFMQRGTYEFFAHPTDALCYLEDGIVIEGKRLPCVLSSTPYYPFIGAWQIVAKDMDVNVAFIAA